MNLPAVQSLHAGIPATGATVPSRQLFGAAFPPAHALPEVQATQSFLDAKTTLSGRCVPILGIWPGERQFTWMPCAASSTASERVKFTLHGESQQGDQRVTGGEVVATDPGARGAGRRLRRTTAPLAAW